MKRFGWLVLLVSLGVNLGLGYRLLSPPVPADDSTWNFAEGKEHPRSGQYSRGRRGGGPDDHAGFSTRDSSQWRRIMSSRLERIAQRLELTPEQVATFRTTHQSNAPVLLAQRLKVDQTRDHLRAVIAGGAMDADLVRLAARDMASQQARLDSLITETMLLEMKILNSEQRAQYLQILPVFKNPVPGRGSGRGSHFRGH